ncbi:MAG: hypothetical protein R2697_03270 [Ilumatobacteraceae bacterium]
MTSYHDLASAIAPTGMVLRGGFAVEPDDQVQALADGRRPSTVVIVGNVGGAMWPVFRAEERDEPDPLDAWTRRRLRPVAERFGAEFVHPSDEPFQPFQRWAQRASDVWQSPIGLLVHPTDGLWHALRGAFLFAGPVDGIPSVGNATSPCVGCAAPCLTTCPVDAFTAEGYDHESCRGHIRSGAEPACLEQGCAARRACPVNATGHYGPDQMRFHMHAFVGW